MFKAFLGLIVVALIWTAVRPAAPPSLPELTPGSNPAYKPLAGKAIGIILLDPQDVLALEGRHGPKGAACFSSEGGSYRWFYTAALEKEKGESRTFLTNDPGKKEVRIDHLIWADRSSLKKRGIEDAYSLVEVEVNRGQGSGPEDRFAATGLKKLDGSNGYMAVKQVIERLEREYRDFVRRRQSEIDEKMEKARREAKEKMKSGGARGQTERATVTRRYLTWLNDAEKLLVEFRTFDTEGEYFEGKGTDIKGPPPPRRVPAGQEAKKATKGVRHGNEWGVETGMIYEVKKTGEQESSRELPLRTFFRALKPPQGQSPPIQRRAR